MIAARLLAEIPSPSQGVWHLGPLPIRAYSLAILAGIIAAVWITQRRWVERGGDADTVLEISFWAVPFGIVGGRLYHVISSPEAYFGPHGDLSRIVEVWQGGLGIWGAVALGAVGAWIGARRSGVRLPVFADALAPGLLVAQAIGRLGNWFNQELFGSPTTLPWGLRIDADSPNFPPDTPAGTLFHPTFLYELLWNLAAAAVLVRLDRRYRWGHGRTFWAYVVAYTTGRLWIELLRIDPAETVLGLRLNVWTALIVGLAAAVAFVVVGRRHPGREDSPALHPTDSRPEAEDVSGPDDDEHDHENEPADTAHPAGRDQADEAEHDGADEAQHDAGDRAGDSRDVTADDPR